MAQRKGEKMAELKYKTVKDVETFTKIETMGNFEEDFKNGELWQFNGEMYYLSQSELPSNELKELKNFYRGPETI